MKRIAVVTTSRADFGILSPVLRAIDDAEDFELVLVASGTHLSAAHGFTLDEVLAAGFSVSHTIECLSASDDPAAVSRAMSAATGRMADVLEQEPDLDALVVLGDRFEMHAIAVAAVPFAVPIVHIHGGELTEGAIDDSLRHSLTKISHLHFVSTDEYRRRVLQLGEAPDRVLVSGAPALDNLDSVKLYDHSEFESEFGISLPEEFLLVTLHPVTREFEKTEQYAASLVSALEEANLPVLITAANADTFGSKINTALQRFAAAHDHVWFVQSLGLRGYYSAMQMAAAMVGNSSSGIIEAASFHLPVVNIGRRQGGRAHGSNVLHVEHDTASILAGIRDATATEFRQKAREITNPYGVGNAAQLIVSTLRTKLQEKLWQKSFHDLEDVP